MRNIKSERLKKLEADLSDLQHWLKLGLVPKKDIEKHKEEIKAIQAKIEEEKERLHFLKESGEAEEYVTPKRPSLRPGYTDMPTIPDLDIGETAAGVGDTNFDMETDAVDVDTSVIEERDEEAEDRSEIEDDRTSYDDEDDHPFSEKNRWRRGGIPDPDADEW